jgi:hypothetical protein
MQILKLVLPLLLLFNCSWIKTLQNLNSEIERSAAAVTHNRSIVENNTAAVRINLETVEKSTAAIVRNLDAIEKSTRAITQSTAFIQENDQALDKIASILTWLPSLPQLLLLLILGYLLLFALPFICLIIFRKRNC